ncbi:MAG: hypothetical protein AAGE84_32110 [Cyanobacteria bacterium P01_G01_bin.39]
MFGNIPQKLNILYTTVLMASTVAVYVETTTEHAKAQSSDYLYSSCINAYQNYQHYNNQPVASPFDSDFGTSSNNMRMANQALNTVTDCAIKYSQLVSKDSSYCSSGLNYMKQISPIMSTAAITINHNCLK